MRELGDEDLSFIGIQMTDMPVYHRVIIGFAQTDGLRAVRVLEVIACLAFFTASDAICDFIMLR
jgi:3-deoxy-D-manno-octulosonate 8-phosphate phosphatase KdsC-like HAD superfamily phosphatase